METSQPLATESFSYSWLPNAKPAFDGLESSEMDYNIVKSKRFSEESQNFNFDTPIPQSPVALVHADELFSNGLIKIKAFGTSDSIPAAYPLTTSLSSRIVPSGVRTQCSFLGKWRKPSKQIMEKCFGFFRPLSQKFGGSRKSTRVDDIDRRAWEVRSWSNSPQASPQQSAGDWSDFENPIYEAVLHCKRSIEK